MVLIATARALLRAVPAGSNRHSFIAFVTKMTKRTASCRSLILLSCVFLSSLANLSATFACFYLFKPACVLAIVTSGLHPDPRSDT